MQQKGKINSEVMFVGSRKKKKETKFEKILYGCLCIVMISLLAFFTISTSEGDTYQSNSDNPTLAELYDKAYKIDAEKANDCAELGYTGKNYKASYACLYEIIEDD